MSYLLVSILFSVSCHSQKLSFATLLEEIDFSPHTASTELFMQAATLALGTEDQLKLLKRASKRTPDSYADISSVIASREHVTEPVALVLLDAFLSANRSTESLALFQNMLDISDWPCQFAESYVLSLRNGHVPSITIEQLVICADATGNEQFLVYAAVLAMTNGDRATARSLLVDSQRFVESGHSSASYLLLWDAGAIELVSNLVPQPADPQEVAVCADAEYLLGNIASATASWAYLIDRFPVWSWKPYAALARVISTQPDAKLQDWPHIPSVDSWAARSSPSFVESQLYSKIMTLFTDSAEAALEVAHWLYSRNKLEEARTLVSSLTGELVAVAQLRYVLPSRAVSEVMRLVAEFPSSPLVNDAALEVLAKAGAWERFSELVENTHVNSLQTRRAWFWDTLALVLVDDVTKAAQMIRNYGPELSDYAGSMNLGILELASYHANLATAAFMKAVDLAHDSQERAIAYVRTGDAFQMAKLPKKAASAYEAALSIDPLSRESRSRLMRLKIHE